MRAAKRVGRYLRKAPVAWLGFSFHDPRLGELLCYKDADWASDMSSRRPTSGGVVTLGLGERESCSQPLRRARDHWESELMDLGYNCSATVATDSQSVIDHSRRRGHSVASKHVGLRRLWLQEALENRKLGLEKVDTATNPALMYAPKRYLEIGFASCVGWLGCTYAAVKKTWVTIPTNGI